MAATIEQQSAQTRAGSAARTSPAIAAVFAEEQRVLGTRGVPPGAVSAGDRLDDFRLPDASGTSVSLGDLVSDGLAVLVFYRGGWCPYCNIALRAYQRDLLPHLAGFGARLVAISPQAPDQSLATQEKASLAFTVLSDAGARLADSLGLAFSPNAHVLGTQRELGLDLSEVNADPTPRLPMPTVLIVDQSRTVRFADTHADYTERTEVAVILAALRDL